MLRCCSRDAKRGQMCMTVWCSAANLCKCRHRCGFLVHPHVSCPALLILYHISLFFSSLLWPSVTELGFKSKKRPQLHLLTLFLTMLRHYLSPEYLILCTHWRCSAFSFCVYSAQDRIPSPTFLSSHPLYGSTSLFLHWSDLPTFPQTTERKSHPLN